MHLYDNYFLNDYIEKQTVKNLNAMKHLNETNLAHTPTTATLVLQDQQQWSTNTEL